MSQHDPEFDDSLRSALKRSSLSQGASAQIRTKVAAVLRAGAPAPAATTQTSAPRTTPKTTLTPALNDPRVFGLPRVWGLAAALAMLLVGGSLTFYQLRDFLPRRSTVAKTDGYKEMILALKQVHEQSADAIKVSTEIAEFQRTLPAAMPVATLTDPGVRFVNARVTALNGQLCYALTYLIDSKPFTLVTANARIGYTIPTYKQVEGSVRLTGGERGGYLVCLIGDARVNEARSQALLDGSTLLPSPSTQPVTAVSDFCASAH